MSILARRTILSAAGMPRALLSSSTLVLGRRAASSDVPRKVQFDPSDISPKAEGERVGQSPNRAQPWSRDQNPKDVAWDVSRMEQTYVEFQPDSLSAMKLVNEQPIVKVTARKAVCDGGGGPLGHPKIYINLDQEGPHTCGYCSNSVAAPSPQHNGGALP